MFLRIWYIYIYIHLYTLYILGRRKCKAIPDCLWIKAMGECHQDLQENHKVNQTNLSENVEK